ncbi:MAG TPA: hypothetical protein DCY61_03370 [Dehalococcoidia bacterium]|nr:hypothetical protein [Dehalococcoidia bacterium]
MLVSELRKLADQLESSLRLRTRPVGLRLFERAADMKGVKSREFAPVVTLCQVMTASRVFGWTIHATKQGLFPLCSYISGLSDHVPEKLLSAYGEVWFKNKEDGFEKFASIPHIPSDYEGLIVSPLAAERIEPDLILIFGTPAQMMRIINALQWEHYERFQMFSVGETACADSLAQAYISKKPAITIPCFGERRFGHVQDDEMIAVLPLESVERLSMGLEAMDKAGIRYPIPYYGIQSDLIKGMPPEYLRAISTSPATSAVPQD